MLVYIIPDVFPKLLQLQLLNFFSDLNMRCFTFNIMSSHTINHMVEFANPFTVACIISSMRFHLKSGPWVRSGPCFSQTHSRLRFFIQGLRKKTGPSFEGQRSRKLSLRSFLQTASLKFICRYSKTVSPTTQLYPRFFGGKFPMLILLFCRFILVVLLNPCRMIPCVF